MFLRQSRPKAEHMGWGIRLEKKQIDKNKKGTKHTIANLK